MAYWVSKWDWECPTLFGIELDELKHVSAQWPLLAGDNDSIAQHAAIVALRELLHGASSVAPGDVKRLIGLSHDGATTLLARLSAGH